MLLIPSSPIGITLRNLSKPSSHDPRVIEGAAFKDSLSSWTICLLSIPVQRIFGTTCPPPNKTYNFRIEESAIKGSPVAKSSDFLVISYFTFHACLYLKLWGHHFYKNFQLVIQVWPFIQELQSSKCGKACPTLPSSMAITVTGSWDAHSTMK